MLRLIVAASLVCASFTAAFAAAPWALVKVAAACFRSEPAQSAELETQASYGTPMRILEHQGEWYRVELPDGYKVWIIASSIATLSENRFDDWRKSPRLIVTTPLPVVARTDSVAGSRVAFDAVIGSIFAGRLKPGAHYAEITTPDGRRGFLPAADVDDFENWSRRPLSLAAVLDAAESMMGITYLWGGTTPKAADCSGFTKISYGATGLILPRNASQQANVGTPLDVSRPDLYKPGDLLFFGSGNGTKITHVAIYTGNNRYLHASGRVFESSYDKSDPLYLGRRVLKARRILPATGAPSAIAGVTPFRLHPWYF